MLAFLAILALTKAMTESPARHDGFIGQSASSPMSATSSELPPVPSGKSTVIGGEIRSVDPVRDQLRLAVFHGKTLTILYDERTLVDRDGMKAAVISLKPSDHASIETTLDGQAIFALRIHVLSAKPEGNVQGSVIHFDPTTSELEVGVSGAKEGLKFHLAPSVKVLRVGQIASSGQQGLVSTLSSGSLLQVTFTRGKDGRATATHIEVSAVPGSVFRFAGELSFVDVPGGRLTLSEGTDHQSQDIAFDPSHFPESRDLHEGTHVRVTAVFDGTRYLAREIAVE